MSKVASTAGKVGTVLARLALAAGYRVRIADIERAERRRAELGYSPGLIAKILADGEVVWTGCGQRCGYVASTAAR